MTRKFEINPRVGWRWIDSEVVVFNCENQIILVWNEIASLLWEKIFEGKDFDDLVIFLSNNFGIRNKKAKKDVANFFQDAQYYSLIKYTNKNSNFQTEDTQKQLNEEGENILLDIEMKSIEKKIPFAITFETTYACNENCIHCYMDRNLPSLTTKKIKSILNEIAASGCLFISFTGGEFFARNDALDIVKHASNLHFVIDILSNGTLITKKIAHSISKHPVRRIQLSLYGATAESHDHITRLPGSFKKTMECINFLSESGVKVEIALPLMNINFHERYAIKTLAESLNCLISPSPIITARNNGSKDTLDLRLKDSQLKEFLEDEDFSALYSGRKPFQDHQFYFKSLNIMDAAPCYSGFNSCAITPSGKVLPCNQLLYEVGDLNRNSFSEIWNNSKQLKYLRGLKISDLTECSNCKNLLSCARCPGLAFLEENDILSSSKENCRITEIYCSLQR
ncbi:MAG: PqqD family peptide modification chaperone [Patescibacteria group bacterium]